MKTPKVLSDWSVMRLDLRFGLHIVDQSIWRFKSNERCLSSTGPLVMRESLADAATVARGNW